MLVLGYFHSTPERVPCIVLQAQLPVFRTGIKTLLVMGNAVCGNTYCCTTGRSYKYLHVPTQDPGMGYGVIQVGSFALVGLPWLLWKLIGTRAVVVDSALPSTSPRHYAGLGSGPSLAQPARSSRSFRGANLAPYGSINYNRPGAIIGDFFFSPACSSGSA